MLLCVNKVAGVRGVESIISPGSPGSPGSFASFGRMAVAVACLAIVGSCAGIAIAAVAALMLGVTTLAPAAAGSALGMAACCRLWRRRLAVHLPADLDRWFARRRVLAIVWFVAALLSVANSARIGIFIADPSQEWASAFPPLRQLAQHQCFAAYVRAGDLAAQRQASLWNPADYAGPGSNEAPSAAVPPRVRGLSAYLGDPFQYPPTFAVLPRAALWLSDDYQLLRVAWFGITAVGFWLAFLALAIWVGGRAGAGAVLLAPIAALSVPFMLCLQFGQAHLLVLAAAIGAMLQFARGRSLSGGLLLGIATTAKIFPGLLIIHLIVRRQWRAVAATIAAIGLLVGVSALVLGPATLTAYVSEYLPRLASGEAFSFAEKFPDNYAPYGLAFKLSALGVEGADRHLAAQLAWGWGILALGLTVLGSLRASDRRHDAVLWLGILCLATLRSPLAPTYTAVGTLWLLSLGAGAMAPRRWLTTLVAISWVLLQGFPPVLSAGGNALVSFPAQLATIGLAVLAVWPTRPRWWAAERDQVPG
jgi:hypothetical protein